MTKGRVTLAEGAEHLKRVVDQVEAIRWQLLGIQFSLPESLEEEDRLVDLKEEKDPATELRSTIACVLNDDIRPALQDLRGVLASITAILEEK